MIVDILNYNNLTCNGLLNINIPDNNYYSFDNIFLKVNNNLISIYEFFNISGIYIITKNSISYNKCNVKGLYLIESIDNCMDNKIIILRRINEDESELISNIDSNSNYIIIDNCKLYKAGEFNKNLYYCYKCCKYIWK